MDPYVSSRIFSELYGITNNFLLVSDCTVSPVLVEDAPPPDIDVTSPLWIYDERRVSPFRDDEDILSVDRRFFFETDHEP